MKRLQSPVACLRRMLPILLAAVLLAGCSTDTPVQETSVSSSAGTSAVPTTSLTSTPPATTPAPVTTPPSGEAQIYIVFDQEAPDVYPLPNTGTLDASVLLQGIARLTGWNCDVNHVEILSGIARVDLAETALPFTWTGEAERDHDSSANFYAPSYVDTVFLFLDSIQQTLMKNLGLSGVIFTQNDGQPLRLNRLQSAVELFPADTAYRGSSYYRALLLDTPEFSTDEYELVQLACGMTVLCPKSFQPDGEGDAEYHMVYEQGDQIATIVWHEYPLNISADDSEALLQESKRLLAGWRDHLTAMDSVTWTDTQTATDSGYMLDGAIGTYRCHVTGFLAPVHSAYYEVVLLYDPALSEATDSFPGMETIVRDLSYALSHYN